MARFLLIEPHQDIRRLYAAVVRGLGHEPICLDSETNERPDVILVDPSDPVSLETTTRLRQDYPDVAIVCASIYETTRDRRRSSSRPRHISSSRSASSS